MLDILDLESREIVLSVCNRRYVCAFFISLSIAQTLDIALNSYLTIRGWVRKFCQRCYNFVNRHDRLLCYTLIERAAFLLYNDAKIMHERNTYFEIEDLKDN